MNLLLNTPKQALNKAYLKEKVGRSEIELFKKNFLIMLSRINEQESEEHGKNVVSDFLKDTWYKEQYEINTKDRKDLVIHTGKSAKDAVGVIVEVKKPGNKAEMIAATKPNTKAMQELILYYLRERIDGDNKFIRHLIITNIHEWYLLDEVWFEKHVYGSARLRKDYEDYKASGKPTHFFYDSIARPFIDGIHADIPCTYFDIRDYQKTIRNADKTDDNKLIALYKILSPAHLLKEKFANDSNTLDRGFYGELLHIIGLEEIKDGGKKLIRRKNTPNETSLIENTIIKLEDRDALRNITNLSTFGSTAKEQTYNVALELCITWVNRILFLKLLEAQLARYHKGDKTYLFLNSAFIHDFDELANLFFGVLAERPAQRRAHLAEKFRRVPYLNSSLFERTELERQAFDISMLDNQLQLPLTSQTVLKNDKGKRLSGALTTLNYFFRFLDAYDFGSEGAEEIQEENKNLINASVLGLIFEKINGYKDGSFFTPGFVTMYMCRETIRRAVIQKFNDAHRKTKGEAPDTPDRYASLHDVYEAISKDFDKKTANVIINSLTICDPAVGSGHFLVSALNEIIAIKSELHILIDREGRTLRDCEVVVENDDLIVTEEGQLFEYKPGSRESRRIQEAIFHEKQTIIENCLFGVDINPNSVKICRLRLWIELLKHAYYTEASSFTELETLPNIDINIKTGNSLISRFPLDADLAPALKTLKWDIQAYRGIVQDYKNASSKEEKRGLEELINGIKRDFRSEIGKNDPKVKRLSKLNGEYYVLMNQQQIFELSKAEHKARKTAREKLEAEIAKISGEVEEIKSNKIYEQAFEWRFEFPEVLDAEGRYIGFDVVIGNPPYVDLKSFDKAQIDYMFGAFKSANNRVNLFSCFIERSMQITTASGYFSQIIPTSLSTQTSYSVLRRDLLSQSNVLEIIRLPNETFGDFVGDVKVDTMIIICRNSVKMQELTNVIVYGSYNRILAINKYTADSFFRSNQMEWAGSEDFRISFTPSDSSNLLEKIKDHHLKLEDCAEISLGITPYDKYRGHSVEQIENKVFHSDHRKDESFKPLLLGNDVKQYVVDWNGKTHISYGTWLGAARDQRFFSEKHILVKQIIDWTTNKIWAAITDDEVYNSQNAFNILPYPQFTHEYIVALLNSKLMSYYHRKKFLDEYKARFQKILIKDCRTFPIPNITVEQQQPYVSLVEIISQAKSADTNADTTLHEQRIDQLVYELFGLTEEDIKTIEG